MASHAVGLTDVQKRRRRFDLYSRTSGSHEFTPAFQRVLGRGQHSLGPGPAGSMCIGRGPWRAYHLLKRTDVDRSGGHSWRTKTEKSPGKAGALHLLL